MNPVLKTGVSASSTPYNVRKNMPANGACWLRRSWNALSLAVWVAFCLLSGGNANAQVAAPIEIDPRDEVVPPPPAFSKDKLLPLDMPIFMSLRFGVDPASISISSTRTVRYVIVATSVTGASNVMYEGLRCEAGEFITYARQSSDGQWNLVPKPQWRPLTDINTARHALAFARQGACEGRSATASSVADMVRALKAR